MVDSLLNFNGAQAPMDEEMAGFVDDAFASNEFSADQFGVEMASPEEQALHDSLMEGIIDVVHGSQSDKVAELIVNAGEPYEGIGLAGQAILMAAHMEAHRQGVEVPMDVYMGENGVVQETAELLWEVGTAIGVIAEDDEEQFAAGYLNMVRLLGEAILELDDPTAVASAQEFLLELELGHEVNSKDYMPQDESMMAPQDPMMDQMPPMGGQDMMGY